MLFLMTMNKFSILNGEKYLSSGEFQNHLVFIPAKIYIKYFSGTTRIESSRSNGMSEESIQNITKLDSNFAPTFVDRHLLPDITFNGHSLIKSNISVPKKGNTSMYFLHPNSLVKKFKHRFYIK